MSLNIDDLVAKIAKPYAEEEPNYEITVFEEEPQGPNPSKYRVEFLDPKHNTTHGGILDVDQAFYALLKAYLHKKCPEAVGLLTCVTGLNEEVQYRDNMDHFKKTFLDQVAKFQT